MTFSYLLLIGFVFFTACKNDATTQQPKMDAHAAHNSASKSIGGYADSVNDGRIETDTLKGSPIRTLHYMANGNHFQITYGSPGVKGRQIWGGLVAFNQVWVAGAHKATKVEFNKPIKVESTIIAAGTYALFTIPAENGEWDIIVNSDYDQHLADNYDVAKDVFRTKVKVQQLNKLVPRLTYQTIMSDTSKGTLEMSWEKVKWVLPFEFTAE